MRAAIPALLLHCSIGTVYCWSIFSQDIADYIGFSKGATEWAFSFAIFNAAGRLGLSAMGDKMKDRNTIHKIIFIASIACTAVVILTNGITKGAGNMALTALVLVLIMVVNAGYGGGFSNVPTLLSDQYGMGSISALHGITLSAWAFAGLTGNQMASWIVSNFGEEIEIAGNIVNPVGYQTVLYVTLALYAVALVLSLVFVKSVGKDK